MGGAGQEQEARGQARNRRKYRARQGWVGTGFPVIVEMGVRAWPGLEYLPISWTEKVARAVEVRRTHSCPAPNKQVQHVLAYLVVVLVQELVHLGSGMVGS